MNYFRDVRKKSNNDKNMKTKFSFFIIGFLALSARAADILPAPLASFISTTRALIQSPKGAETFAIAPVLVSKPVSLFMPSSNVLPNAVISIGDIPQPAVYALEFGLNTSVSCTIHPDGLGNVIISYAVHAGKIYQIQFRILNSGSGWSSWCCAYGDYIPASDGQVSYTFPIFLSEPGRLFRVMSNE